MMNRNTSNSTAMSSNLRYKPNQKKISCLEDARAIRAVEKKQEWKKLREKSLAPYRRVTNTPLQNNKNQASNSRSTKKYSKEELKEMGKKRFQEMLKWKAERRKKIESEKQKRKPSFKTGGVYNPSPLGYLSGNEGESPCVKVTPWKFSNSAQKSGRKTPSSVMSHKKGSGVAKVLHFKSGATPQLSAGGVNKLKDFGSSTRDPRRRNSRSMRTFRPPPTIGFTPLPDTPSFDSSRPFVSRRQKSFAPANFSFQAPKGLKSYDLMHEDKENVQEKSSLTPGKVRKMLELEEDTSCHSSGKDDKESEVETQNLSLQLEDESSDEVKKSTKQLLNVSFTIEDEGESASTLSTSNRLNVSFTVIEKCEELEDEIDGPASTLENNPKIDGASQSPVNTEHEIDGASQSPINEEPKVDASHSPCHKLPEICGASHSPINEEPVVDAQVNKEPENDAASHSPFSKDPEIDGASHLALSEDDDITFKEHLVTNAGSTPGPSLACKRKSKVKVTPPLAKLRPRTPCSRKTRRSRSAHCDHTQWELDSLMQLSSAKKNKRKSVRIKTEMDEKKDDLALVEENGSVKVENTMGHVNARSENEDAAFKQVDKLVNEDSQHLTPVSTTKDSDEQAFKTPSTSKSVKSRTSRIEKRIAILNSSPWITRSRGSSSSSKDKKKGKIFSNELEAFFNDDSFTADPAGGVSESKERDLVGSPHLRQDILPKTPAGDEFTQNSLDSHPDELIQPTFSELPASPEIMVWGPESVENSPLDLGNLPEDGESKALPTEAERVPLAEITPAPNAKRRGRPRSSKRGSVSFAPETSFNDSTHTRFSVTPVRKSTRISMGIFAKAQENIEDPSASGEDPKDRLIHVDSPLNVEEKSSSAWKNRVSLLPGLYAFEEKDETATASSVSEEEDLISWVSPKTVKTPQRRSRKSKLDTPIRRSTRLSKAGI